MNTQRIELFFKQVTDRIDRVHQDLPKVIGNEAVNFAIDNLEKQSWEGKPWAKRKSKKDTGRALLVKSGRLKRSPRVISSAPGKVTVGSDVPYAAVHNNGGSIERSARSETFVRNRYTRGEKGKMFGGMGAYKKGTSAGQGLTFKAYGYQMPERRFLGASPQLKRRLIVAAGRHIQEILKA
jgi:phage gpG-like protein